MSADSQKGIIIGKNGSMLKKIGTDSRLELEEIIEGKVTNIKPFGAFVEIYPDVEGLINNKQIEEYQLKTNKTLEKDSVLQVEIKRFDAKEQKIILKIV